MGKICRKEQFETRCEQLRRKAKELGRDWLYSWEAAEAIGVALSNMSSYNRTFIKRDADIPKIIFNNRSKKTVRSDYGSDIEVPEKTDRWCYYYPSGLQVASVKKLPGNKVLYSLK